MAFFLLSDPMPDRVKSIFVVLLQILIKFMFITYHTMSGQNIAKMHHCVLGNQELSVSVLVVDSGHCQIGLHAITRLTQCLLNSDNLC